MACIAFANILVNIRRTFRYFGSTLGYVGSTLEYIGSTFGYVKCVGSTPGYVRSALLFVAFARALVNIRSTLGVFLKYLRVY